MKFGNKIHQLRKEKRLSLKELSQLTNLSISFLSDIEHGRSNPSISSLEVICSALETTVSDILSDEITQNKVKYIDYSDIIALLKDFSSWDNIDKEELFHYLNAKKNIREFK